MKSIKTVLSYIKANTIKNSPSLLIGIGIAGMISSTVIAVKSTIKVTRILDEKKPETKKELIKESAPYYVLPTITTIASVVCILWGNSQHLRRNAALAAAYSLSDSTLKEYKTQLDDILSKKKATEFKDSIAKEKMEKTPLKESKEVIVTGKGETLFFDVVSGRYFKSDIEKIRRVENLLNKRIISEMWISLNDFYYEIGLDRVSIGDDIGWNVNQDGYISFDFSAQLTDDDIPCIVLDYLVAPRWDYRDYH